MVRRLRPIGAVALLVLLSTAPGLTQAPAAKDPAADPGVLGAERLFTAWVEGQLRFHEYPGMVVGVVAGERLVWARGFGLADIAARVPMTPQTKFRMASHSKLFTATAIMQLREQGKLRPRRPGGAAPALVHASASAAETTRRSPSRSC